MNNVLHTPGPWEVHVSGLIRRCFDDIAAPIAEMRTPYRHGVGIVKGEHEQWYNARLIAAAPELLEVAQGILAEDMRQYLPAEYVAKVSAAIAKATGQ